MISVVIPIFNEEENINKLSQSITKALSDIDYEKLGHYFSLEKKEIKKTDKIVNLINSMLKNLGQIKNMMSSSNIKVKNIKENYIKNLKNEI